MPEAPSQFEHEGHRYALHPRGEGPRVVLLHSGGLSGAQWGRLQGQLRARYQSFAVDLLGYGDSARWPEELPFDPALDVEAVAALAGQLGPLHLVGHSYGGFIALQVARRFPERVRSLALFEPVAFGVLHPEEDAAAIAELERLEIELRRAGAGPGLHAAHPDPLPPGEGKRAERIAWLRAFVDFWMGEGWFGLLKPSVRDAYVSVAHVMRGQVEIVSRDQTPLQAYRAIRAPALLMSGEKSPLPARRVCVRFAQGLPDARRVELAGAGHMAPIINSGEVNAELTAHLDRAVRTPAEIQKAG